MGRIIPHLSRIGKTGSFCASLAIGSNQAPRGSIAPAPPTGSTGSKSRNQSEYTHDSTEEGLFPPQNRDFIEMQRMSPLSSQRSLRSLRWVKNSFRRVTYRGGRSPSSASPASGDGPGSSTSRVPLPPGAGPMMPCSSMVSISRAARE